jgi:acyl carrier protein
MDMASAVKQFIVSEFAPDLDATELDSDYDLLDRGVIDSLGLLTVLAWAEDRFGVIIDAGEIDEEDFRTVRAICAVIARSGTAPADVSR